MRHAREVTYGGHSLTVPVLDRGPYATASWDLTAGAAEALDITETVRIATQIVGKTANTPTLGLPPGSSSAAVAGGALAGEAALSVEPVLQARLVAPAWPGRRERRAGAARAAYSPTSACAASAAGSRPSSGHTAVPIATCSGAPRWLVRGGDRARETLGQPLGAAASVSGASSQHLPGRSRVSEPDDARARQ